VRFSATGVDPEGGPLTYLWELQGMKVPGQTVVHRFTEPGTYTATVTATDEDGNSASDEVAVTVTAPQSVDTGRPTVAPVSPRGRVKDRTPRVVAIVRDSGSGVDGGGITVKVDGKRLRFTYDEQRGRVVAAVRKALKPGLHRVKVVAVDRAGNRTVRRWSFRVVRR
jgi:hypothetical protein